jgi:hypothetical protein
MSATIHAWVLPASWRTNIDIAKLLFRGRNVQNGIAEAQIDMQAHCTAVLASSLAGSRAFSDSASAILQKVRNFGNRPEIIEFDVIQANVRAKPRFQTIQQFDDSQRVKDASVEQIHIW